MKGFLKKYYHLVAIAITLIAAIFVLCFVDATPSDDDRSFDILLKKDKLVPFFKEAYWEADSLVLIPEFASAFPKGEYMVRLFLEDKKSGGIVNVSGYFRVGGPEVLRRVIVPLTKFTVIYDWEEKQEYPYEAAADWIRKTDMSTFRIQMLAMHFFTWFNSAPGVGFGENRMQSSGVYSEQFVIRDGQPSNERSRNKYVILDNRTVNEFLKNGLLRKTDILISDKEGPDFIRYRFDSWYDLKKICGTVSRSAIRRRNRNNSTLFSQKTSR